MRLLACALMALVVACAEGAADDPGGSGAVILGPTPTGQATNPTQGAAGMVVPMAGAGAPAMGTAGMSAFPMTPMGGAGAAGMAGMSSVGQPAGSGAMAAAGGAAMMPTAGRGGSGAPMMPMAGSGAPMAGSMAAPMVPAGMEVPATAHCMPVATWDPAWTAFEDEVLKLVNENRAKGWNCDTKGMFAAAGPLASSPQLRCAARLHSKDMYDRDFFDHSNPSNQSPLQRVSAAGFMGTAVGENIAMGQQTPARVVSGWMDSDGHCANIMNTRYKQIGVGFFKGEGSPMSLYWTQNFGS